MTILITSRDRQAELQYTLLQLRRLKYPSIELIVFDDASADPLEPMIQREWPGARVVRRAVRHGLITNRSEGMRLARGDYIVSLDDDSHLVEAEAIQVALSRLETERQIGALAFRILDPLLPGFDGTRERYVESFVGCGHMLRRAAVEEVGGYRDFFESDYEEMEYGLRLWDRGWRILFYPGVSVEHRRSLLGRSTARTERYRRRNSLWTILLNYPFPRVVAAFTWQVLRNGFRTFGAGFRGALWAWGSALRGMPNVFRHRRPVAARTIHLIDVLRFRSVSRPEQLAAFTPVTLSERWRWIRNDWISGRKRSEGERVAG